MAIPRNTILQNKAILNPDVSHFATVEYTVVNGNPNGDPDNFGAPRVDDDGYALTSDGSLKRKIRDYLSARYDRLMYIPSDLQERMIAAGHDPDKVYQLKDWATHHKASSPAEACSKFWDVRMFGAVYGTEGKGSSKHQILGPIQVGFGRSTEPVDVVTMGITRVAAEVKDQDRTMGSRTYIPEAIIRQRIRFSGHLAKRHGITEEDMLDFWEAVINSLDFQPSGMRGETVVTKLTIKTFCDEFGTYDPTVTATTPVETVITNPTADLLLRAV